MRVEFYRINLCVLGDGGGLDFGPEVASEAACDEAGGLVFGVVLGEGVAGVRGEVFGRAVALDAERHEGDGA